MVISDEMLKLKIKLNGTEIEGLLDSSVNVSLISQGS